MGGTAICLQVAIVTLMRLTVGIHQLNKDAFTVTVNLSWLDEEHTIFLFEYIGSWTWDELYQAMDQAFAMGTVGIGIASIHDLSRGNTVPANPFQHARHLSVTLPDNPIMVIVGANVVVLAILDLLRRILHTMNGRYFTAASKDEAVALIRHQRTSVK